MLLYNILLGFFLSSSFAAIGDGTLVGNGGNTVLCQEGPQNRFNGFYTLDYLLDYRESGDFARLATVTSWEDSQVRIASGLKKVSPILYKSFMDFSLGIVSRTPSSGRNWIAWDLSKILINDQEIHRRLPGNCYLPDGQNLNLRQTVVRSYGPQVVEYRYQADILKALRTQNPLQFSFFMVHEWLWDFTENVRDLRQLNWILHSEKFTEMDPEVWDQLLTRTQFFNRRLPVCHRSQIVRRQLELITREKCQDITDLMLGKIESLDLSQLPADYVFRSGDFSRLYSLRTLDLSRNPGVLTKIPPFAFNDLLNLQIIKAHESGFTSLPDHLREGARKVEVQY